jgi:hypothetical protein
VKGPEHNTPALLHALIHPSAWKKKMNSANLAPGFGKWHHAYGGKG